MHKIQLSPHSYLIPLEVARLEILQSEFVVVYLWLATWLHQACSVPSLSSRERDLQQATSQASGASVLMLKRLHCHTERDCVRSIPIPIPVQ